MAGLMAVERSRIRELEERIAGLEVLERFTLADVVNGLSQSYLIVAGDEQYVVNNHIVIPRDKNGILLLGKRATIQDCILQQESLAKELTQELERLKISIDTLDTLKGISPRLSALVDTIKSEMENKGGESE